MSEYFPKPQSHEKNIKVKIDLSNYAAKISERYQKYEKYYSSKYFKLCIKN